ncbi:MAG: MFS transporter [Anaerolineaceae bacterium]|nr:MFS transporter [Anaerolineaceae bacterium]
MSVSARHITAAGLRERVYRRNFTLLTLDGILFMVAMGIIGPSTVIPDFVRRLTDSEILIGLSGNLFHAGYALPQLFVARLIVRSARKKRWFVLPNIPTRCILLVFGLLLYLLADERKELILLVFFLCYAISALGDGLVGVPWADMIGSSLDSRWRSRLYGLMSGGTALVMLAVVPLVALVLGEQGPGFPHNYALLFAASGTVFALSILPGVFLRELPGPPARERVPAFTEFLPQLGRLLRADPQFRALLVIRTLTGLFLMAAPFYIGFATLRLGLSSEVAVPTLLLMQTLGTTSGALLYMWLGARNNVLYLRLALAASVLLPLSALLAATLGPVSLALGFLISGLATSNLFFGYQNWLVEHSAPGDRPACIGLANTTSAVVTLCSPLIGGSIARLAGFETLFVVSLLLALTALLVLLRFIRRPRHLQPATSVA